MHFQVKQQRRRRKKPRVWVCARCRGGAGKGSIVNICICFFRSSSFCLYPRYLRATFSLFMNKHAGAETDGH